MVRALLVSTYELGHQPVHVAKAASVLQAAGHEVRCVDVVLDSLSADDVDWADRVAFAVPMHTAMRLALRVTEIIRERRPDLPLCFFGLYASVSRSLTVTSPRDAVIAGEYERGLVAWMNGEDPGPVVQRDRVKAPVPDRHLLPTLDRYVQLAIGGEERLVGSVEASRGCSHRCRHCPVPIVYGGRVRPVELPSVIADIDQLVDAGARHVSFADPDFLNVPRHAQRVVSSMHERHRDLTFDCTVKVEHILRHRDILSELAESGCAFVVSAFESTNDTILGYLDKGHVAAEASNAVVLLRTHGIEVRPSWLPFTPWTTLDDLVDILDFVEAHDLVDNVDPVQYSIRLLLPERSLLLDHPAMVPYLGPYDAQHLGWTWRHFDPVVDGIQAELAALVEARVGQPVSSIFSEINALVRFYAPHRGAPPKLGTMSTSFAVDRAHLTEPWFCCSEPTEVQLSPLTPLG